jgi:acetaldehyde dehydrogenase
LGGAAVRAESSGRVKVGIIGPGNIGSDLMYKVRRSKFLEMGMMAGIVESEGIRRAASMGVPVSTEGVGAVVESEGIKIAFDATSAAAHVKFNGPLLKKAGIISIDLTPAALGPYCVPSVNLDKLKAEPDINMVTCGGQATIPVIYAINRVAGAAYAEIVHASLLVALVLEHAPTWTNSLKQRQKPLNWLVGQIRERRSSY